MKIFVLMKQVMNCSRQITIDEQNKCVLVEGSHFPTLEDPSSLAALELAMVFRKNVPHSSVIAISLGGNERKDILTKALARGVDRAIHVISDVEHSGMTDINLTALALAEVIRNIEPDLVLCGTKSSDTNSSQLGGMISQLIHLPHIANALKLELLTDLQFIKVLRRMEKGKRLLLKCPLPAVIAVEPSAAEPSYVSVNRKKKTNKNLIHEIALSSICEPQLCNSAAGIVSITHTKPRAKKSSLSAASLSPLERMRLISGQQDAERGKIIEGKPDYLAQEIVRFLQDQRIL